MMRYQRVSPDCLHLNNGRKQANLRTYKDEDASENGRFPSYGHSFDGKAAPLRYRSGTTPPRQDHSSFSHFIASTDTPQSDGHTATATQKNQNHENSPSPSPSRGGDLLLQWGHNKRSRGSRAENRTVTDESSIQPRPLIKLQRRGGFDKHGIINQQQIMPPPPPPPPPTCSSSCTATTHGRGGNLRSFSVPVRDTTGSPLNRNPEDRSGLRNGSSSSNSGAGASSRVGGGVSRSAEKRSPSSPEKTENRKMGSSTVTNMVNEKQQQQQQMVMMINGGSMGQADHGSRVESTAGASAEQEGGGGAVSNGVTIGAGGGMEKVNLEVLEWPRIYVSLSRKEKEDDFYAMKGTKLPQRPKKRAKNIDKTLQYCFPGMWLSDLTRGRYEVREKKCVKKQKRRGLKGMESMESDSE